MLSCMALAPVRLTRVSQSPDWTVIFQPASAISAAPSAILRARSSSCSTRAPFESRSQHQSLA